jgi:trimethylamine--corrinoid protein Co-methyltransferase
MNSVAGVDLAALHKASLQILAEIGVKVEHGGMRERLQERGCRIKGERVYFPAEVVGEALARIPRSFTLYGRSVECAVQLDGRRIWGTNPGIVPWIRDLDSGEFRPTTLADVSATTRLLDAMENVHVVMATLVEAQDVPSKESVTRSFAVALANTVKPLFGPGPGNACEAQMVVALAKAVRGGNADRLRRYPLCLPFVCPISPLCFPEGIVDALVVLAESGVPISIISNPVLGLTSPYTLAGGIALSHAEVLAGIVMVQEIAPGVPVLHHATPSRGDMHTLISITGGPEVGLMRGTIAALARWCHIPSSVHGLHTSSPYLDLQMGQEKALNGLQVALARPDLLGGVGIIANGMATSYEAIVVDNEILGAIFRVVEGYRVDEDHLALDVIAQVVAGDSFVGQRHTVKHLRSGEVWEPRLAVRHEAVGVLAGEATKTMVERAHDIAQQLLSEHNVAPLSEEIQLEIEEILSSGRGENLHRSYHL